MKTIDRLSMQVRYFYKYINAFDCHIKSRMLHLTENEKNIVIDKLIEILRNLDVDVREGL